MSKKGTPAWNKGKPAPWAKGPPKGTKPWNTGTKGLMEGYWKGKKLSEETKRKLSDSHKGKPSHRKKPDVFMDCAVCNKNFKIKPCVESTRKVCSRKCLYKYRDKGLTPIREKIRASEEYKLWRQAVFERDNYSCVWCGDKQGNNLEADHIKPFSLFPELRFAIDNGRTLCKPCHRKTDTYGWKGYHNYIKNNGNKI